MTRKAIRSGNKERYFRFLRPTKGNQIRMIYPMDYPFMYPRLYPKLPDMRAKQIEALLSKLMK